MLAGDFAMHGRMDLMTAAGSGTANGDTFYYSNNGTANPFPNITQTITSDAKPARDLDFGFTIDYDNDPAHTTDAILARKDNSGTYYLISNRVAALYVDSGQVTSNVLDIGALANAEITVTDVRLAPTPATTASTDGSVSWEASNDNGLTWHPATVCLDNHDQYCAVFGSTIGSQIRWRATLYSNTIGTPHTHSPYISSVATTYTYVTAQNHFRAGPSAVAGMVYVGAFREPGNSGQFLAYSDETGQIAWNAADWLDANTASARHVYTSGADNARLDVSGRVNKRRCVSMNRCRAYRGRPSTTPQQVACRDNQQSHAGGGRRSQKHA